MGIVDAEKKRIMDAILKTAYAMKALIVDGGSSSGVMKEIGEAVHKDGDHVATLGVFPWMAVAGIAALKDDKIYRLEAGEHEAKNKAELDRNHRYFALIEKTSDSTNNLNSWWSSEIEARYFIEVALTSPQGNPPRSAPLPHILIVVNGGLGTIETAHMFLTGQFDTNHSETSELAAKIKQVPIVVVQGSGRAADLIAQAWKERNTKISRSETKKPILDTFDALASGHKDDKTIHEAKSILKHFELTGDAELERMEEDELRKIAERVVALSKGEESIALYEGENSPERTLAFSIMKSVCLGTVFKDKQLVFERLQQLKLLMDWNDKEGLEIMRELLMESKARDNFEDSMLHALRGSLVDSVSLLSDFGVQFTQRTLDTLYSNGTKEDCILKARKLLWNLVSCESCSFQSVANTVQNEEAMPDRCSSFKCIGAARSAVVVPLSAPIAQESYPLAASAGSGGRHGDQANHPTRDDMLLWSIFSGRHELAWYFWLSGGRSRTVHCLSRALMACALLRAFPAASSREILERLGQLGLSRPSDHAAQAWAALALRFELAARDILDLCYKKNPDIAISILQLPWVYPVDWFPVRSAKADSLLNPLVLAFKAGAKSFVSHPACQAAIDRLWYGRIVIDHVSSAGLAEALQARQDRISSPPPDWRIKHSGLFGFLGWKGGTRGVVLSLNLLLSSLIVFPVLMSKINLSTEPIQDSEKKESTSGPSGEEVPQNKVSNSSDGLNVGNATDESLRSNPCRPIWAFLNGGHWGCKLVGFYTSPCIKFYVDFASYLTFLILYLVVGFRFDYEYTWQEGLVHLWIIALAVREVSAFLGRRQLFGNNYFEVAMVLCYIPAAALRIYERGWYSQTKFMELGGIGNKTLPDGALAQYGGGPADWARARSWHGIAGVLFWARILDYFRASRTLGPLVPVIVRVSGQALQFFVVLLVAMVAFGSAIICAGRPRYDPAQSTPLLVAQAVFFPFLEIFGEHFIDGYNISISNYPGCDAKDTSCSPQQSLGIVLLCIYLFVSAIILMNLLIASTPLPSRLHLCP